ncbi:hypothetical protein BDV32DRAFT_71032 [Aspergillus pseudonomiae]|uniref:Uncharacterized protein n=1 Tax=Aspergillus pseudonomiae TaxID=1506151 RepID=A0A5N6HXQ7_9EURO|nr:uncharacterized protein BDV37DRAFT_225158 [Aspergillus pseudonomiae]KAB8258369.1 hypothetical protein BDV32DRAFT_71032 [Aspergillus pseudonomiae]KAE8407912.1 hypothetical protein BDV37DRAFT_225158 [Aspergillus pseudonomiae]
MVIHAIIRWFLAVVSALRRGPSFVTAHSRLPKTIVFLFLFFTVNHRSDCYPPSLICDLLSCSLLLLAKAPVNCYQSSVFHKYRCPAARAVSLVACRIRHPKLAPFLFCPSALI